MPPIPRKPRIPESPIPNALAEAIVQRRLALGHSQDRAGEEIGIPALRLRGWEQGKCPRCLGADLEGRLARYLGISVDGLRALQPPLPPGARKVGMHRLGGQFAAPPPRYVTDADGVAPFRVYIVGLGTWSRDHATLADARAAAAVCRRQLPNVGRIGIDDSTGTDMPSAPGMVLAIDQDDGEDAIVAEFASPPPPQKEGEK